MASFSVGAKLRKERIGQGLTIDDIAHATRVAPRFLQAIEKDDFAPLPGLVFARNFVRQYALALKLDPEPLVAELPKLDESMIPLPDPPARRRPSGYNVSGARSIASATAWLALVGGVGFAAYIHFNHSTHTESVTPRVSRNPVSKSNPVSRPEASAATSPEPVKATAKNQDVRPPTVAEPAAGATATPASAPSTAPVQVTVTANDAAWVQVSTDGKVTFTGTLKPNETRAISAEEQVKILTGNAGALKISLNGKTLDALGPLGQVRTVKLTAEGPEFPSKVPQPAPDPL